MERNDYLRNEHLILTRIHDSEFYSARALAHLKEHHTFPQDLLNGEVRLQFFQEYKKLHDIGSRIFAYVFCDALKLDAFQRNDQGTHDKLNRLQLDLLNEQSLQYCLGEILGVLPKSGRVSVFGRNGVEYVTNVRQFLKGLGDLTVPALSVDLNGLLTQQMLISPFNYPGFFRRKEDHAFDELAINGYNPDTVLLGYFNYPSSTDFAESLINKHYPESRRVNPKSVYLRDKKDKSPIEFCREAVSRK